MAASTATATTNTEKVIVKAITVEKSGKKVSDFFKKMKSMGIGGPMKSFKKSEIFLRVNQNVRNHVFK
jgi:hypothetical protein